jgi:transforming growth factor-beta-induced protein
MRTRSTRRHAVAMAVALGVVVAGPSLAAAGTGDDSSSTTTPSSGADDTAAAAPGGAPQGPFCASIPPEGEGSFVGMADDPVATAASNNPYLTTLTSAVQAAGLVDTLNGEGPFTVFAPNNEAFAAIPPADLDDILADPVWLTEILLYHVVPGESLSAADLAAAGSVVTAQGDELTITTEPDGSLSINGGAAMLTCSDITTENATVHVIDAVLLPPHLMDTR